MIDSSDANVPEGVVLHRVLTAITGLIDELERLYSITAAPLPPYVGDTAALNTKSVPLVMSPSWTLVNVSPDSASSYQVTFDTDPFLTVCWVQMPVVASPTACVSLPSSVSMVFEEPFCVATGGVSYELTAMSESW